MKRKKMQQLNMAEYFTAFGEKSFVHKYYRQSDKSSIVYDEITSSGIVKKRNDLMYFKMKIDLLEIETIKSFDKQGYCKYISILLGKVNEQGDYLYKILEEEQKKDDLQNYLNSLVGEVILQAKDRRELIENLNVRDGSNNRLLKGIDTLNGMLKEIKIDFFIDQFETSRIIGGKKKKYKTAWRVRRISDI